MLADETDFETSLARATRELGRENFHERLLELAGSIVSHDSGWIVRYDGQSVPGVIYTKAIPQNVIDYYLDAEPHVGDPYFCSWRENANARIETLADALPMAVDRDFYNRDFMRRAEFTDELVLYLPLFGSTCLSLFFELRDGYFDEQQLRRLQTYFPAVLGLHEAHLRMVLADLRSQCNNCTDNSFSVVDKDGETLFSTAGWRRAEENLPQLRAITRCKLACACAHCNIDEFSVRDLPLGNNNTLAPGGRLIYLAPGPSAQVACEKQKAVSLIEKLTPRERDILQLTLEGHCTGVIAQRLQLAKGYIKNCRLRMYKKFDVTSERQLMTLLNPLVEVSKDQPQACRALSASCNSLSVSTV